MKYSAADLIKRHRCLVIFQNLNGFNFCCYCILKSCYEKISLTTQLPLVQFLSDWARRVVMAKNIIILCACA